MMTVPDEETPLLIATKQQKTWPLFDAGLLLSLSAVALLLLIGIEYFRPADKTNQPVASVVATWEPGAIPGAQAFVGFGIFSYRPNWHGPAQSFAGPVLLLVDQAENPVHIQFDGPATIDRSNESGSHVINGTPSPIGGTPEVSDDSLQTGDLVSLPARTAFTITTGDGEVVRLQAVTILPAGPPATPGVQVAEWRAWGMAKPVPNAPVSVTIKDLFLGGGEVYSFQRDAGPELLTVEGMGDGATSIALNPTKGQGAYLKIADTPPWDPNGALTFTATQTQLVLNRERVFDARSGIFLPTGSAARLHNRSLVDGTTVRVITFDGASP
jgi:hypothetical protein